MVFPASWPLRGTAGHEGFSCTGHSRIRRGGAPSGAEGFIAHNFSRKILKHSRKSAGAVKGDRQFPLRKVKYQPLLYRNPRIMQHALFYDGDSPDETTDTTVLLQVVLPPFFHAYDNSCVVGLIRKIQSMAGYEGVRKFTGRQNIPGTGHR
jgi:hypothetical protein